MFDLELFLLFQAAGDPAKGLFNFSALPLLSLEKSA